MSEAVAFSVKRSSGDYFWGMSGAALRNRRMWTTYILGGLSVAAIWFVFSHQAFVEKLAGAAVAFVLMICLYAVLFLISLGLAMLRNKKMAGAFDAISYEMSSNGLKVVTETGRSESKWVVWKSWFETPRIIVIRHQTGLVHILPKRQLSEAQLTGVRKALARNVGRS
jgi:hypothetical protein